MPPIYYLNPPPNPFWDFVSGLEDHPFFAQYRRPVPPTPPPQPPRPGAEQAQTQASASAAATEASEKAKGKQAEVNVDDPPEVDPSTIRPEGQQKDRGMPFRGRGRFANAFEDNDKDKGEKGHHHGPPGWHGRDGRHHPRFHHGPPFGGMPPFMGGPRGGPFFGRRGPPMPPHEGPEGPEGRGPWGRRRGRGGWGGDGARCPRGRHGHKHGRDSSSSSSSSPSRSRSPRRGGIPFDLSTFLNNLGERIGVDLTSAAQGLGLDLDRFKSSRTNDTDFEPRTDIFDTAPHYVIHLSLPGAKKSDVGVEWDGEHSVLHIAGVVHRPGVDEELMGRLVVDGRKRETGVFEKNIRLGTKKEPASIDVHGITAKMVDGVLVIHVPKVEKTFQRREVHVEASPEVSVERHEEIHMNERDLLFDTDEPVERDEEMYDAPTTQTPPIRPYPAKAASNSSSSKTKEREAERERDDRSETLGYEYPNETVETLPRYEAEDSSNHENKNEDEMSDWEKAGSEDEGEYVKINVD